MKLILQLVEAARPELHRLEVLNGSPQPEAALRARIEELGSSQPRILATLATFQLLAKINAKIIRAASVTAPTRWLQMLEVAETDILIG